MVAGGFQADHEALVQHAGEFTGLADRAGKIHSDLHQVLAEVGNCWGADQAGTSFAAAHVPASDATLRRLGALSGQLGGVGERFAATAATYQQVELDNANALRATDA